MSLENLKDWLLSKLQRDCKHPGHMCAFDVLEGTYTGVAVSYCNRCGAIKINHLEWRIPDPNLWKEFP